MKYKVMASATPIAAEQLDNMAKDGWLYITTVAHDNMLYHYFYRLTG